MITVPNNSIKGFTRYGKIVESTIMVNIKIIIADIVKPMVIKKFEL